MEMTAEERLKKLEEDISYLQRSNKILLESLTEMVNQSITLEIKMKRLESNRAIVFYPNNQSIH
jgi:hypothetical protein